MKIILKLQENIILKQQKYLKNQYLPFQRSSIDRWLLLKGDI